MFIGSYWKTYLVLIELFSLGVTYALRANIDRKSAISLQRGHFAPKFQVEDLSPILPVRKLGNYFACGSKWAVISFCHNPHV